jgi:Na+-translocating ferredoxin:NAD+ oxidoreductase subunit B
MDASLVLISSAALGTMGAAAAAALGVASRVFKVEEDPRIGALLEILPGANCGGCGYPGCSGFAAALVAGKVDPTACAPGGNELARKAGELLGIEVEEKAKMVARLRCSGGAGVCSNKFVYHGYTSCKAVVLLQQSGQKTCPYGCEGLGDCVTACAFGAMVMGADNLPIIDEEKCTGCKKCVEVCPKDVLAMEPYDSPAMLACSTHLPAKQVRAACSAGCIGCRICVRACPYDALRMEGNLPVRDWERCHLCGLCMDACKPGSMVFARGFTPDPEVRAEAERLAEEKKAAEAARKAAAKAAASKPPAATGVN